MSKSRKRYHEEEDGEYYINGERDHNIQKRKKRKLDRALKMRDLDALLEEDLWGEELDGYKCRD